MSLSSLFLSFLPSLNWEREHTMTILRKGGGRKQFYGVVSFSTTGFLLRVFSLTGSWDSMELGLKASAMSCPRALFHFFTRSFGDSVNTSCHTNCCPKTQLCFFARSLASDPASSHGDLHPQNWFPYSYFRWRKRVLRPL